MSTPIAAEGSPLSDAELDAVAGGWPTVVVAPTVVVQTNVGTQVQVAALSRARFTQVAGQWNQSNT